MRITFWEAYPGKGIRCLRPLKICSQNEILHTVHSDKGSRTAKLTPRKRY